MILSCGGVLRLVCHLTLQWSVITYNRLAKLWASPWKSNFLVVRQNLMVEAFGTVIVVFFVCFSLDLKIL